MAFASAEPTRERVNHKQKTNQNDQTIKQTKKPVICLSVPREVLRDPCSLGTHSKSVNFFLKFTHPESQCKDSSLERTWGIHERYAPAFQAAVFALGLRVNKFKGHKPFKGKVSFSYKPLASLHWSHTDFQSQMLRGLISSVQLLWAGSLIWGLELLVLTGSLWSCDILPTCRLPCQGYGSSPDGISTRLVLQGSFFIFFL